jgi:hypothetical protein
MSNPSDSESEYYDPWPGCVWGHSGCHSGNYYDECFTISDECSSFFNLPQNHQMSLGDMEDAIIDYGKDNGCVYNTTIIYNKELWDLLKPVNSTKMKFYQLTRYVKKLVKTNSDKM